MDINEINSKNSEDNRLRSFYIKAKKELNNGKIKEAYNDFFIAGSILGCAYCRFLQGRLDEAVILLRLITGESPVVNWLYCLIDIIQEDFVHTPSYFQIRNFYESDLNMLFKYDKLEYVNKICSNINRLSFYNREIYKYTARVFLDNGLFDDALFFLKRSIDIYYKDPEVHFMLADLYLLLGDSEKAKSEYIKSNEVSPNYYPALKKLKQIESNCH